MEAAVCNFFVSEALLDFSERITRNAVKKVLYNGVSEKFVRFDDPVRDEVRRKFGVGQDARSVSFAGNLSAVKNVRCLAPLFRMVSDRYDGQLKFFIAGDGKLRHCVEADMREYGVDVRFMGNLPAEDMPSFMNATDVLVLPSLNEGLPLVCAEALRCGANVAGSKVGGIPEIISPDFTVPLGSDFIETLAGLIVRMLEGGVVQEVPEEMDWSVTALKEQRALDRLEFPRKP
jgi:glycosyltransferase involved in cell wall biosynthesis